MAYRKMSVLEEGVPASAPLEPSPEVVESAAPQPASTAAEPEVVSETIPVKAEETVPVAVPVVPAKVSGQCAVSASASGRSHQGTLGGKSWGTFRQEHDARGPARDAWRPRSDPQAGEPVVVGRSPRLIASFFFCFFSSSRISEPERMAHGLDYCAGDAGQSQLF